MSTPARSLTPASALFVSFLRRPHRFSLQLVLSVALFTHPLPLTLHPTLFSQPLFASPLYIPSMFTLVPLASPHGSVSHLCFRCKLQPNPIPFLKMFLTSLHSSFIFLLVSPHLLSSLSWISNIKAGNWKKWSVSERRGRGTNRKRSKWSRRKQFEWSWARDWALM